MKKNKITSFNKYLVVILFLLSYNSDICSGQQTSIFNHCKIIKNMTDNVKNLFYSSNCTYGPLTNGRLYNEFYPNLLGHQFIFSKGWEKGVIYFRNDVQMELNINYDIVSDKLLLNKFYSEGVYCIELNINDIEGFSINGHKFIKIALHEDSKETKGYYELLHEGKAKLLLKWEKYISKAPDPNKDIAYLKKTFYIMNNNKLVKIKNRKSLLYSLSDKARNIENYLKQNKFYVRIAEPDDFVELLLYYDTL
jgi:hypothetical protein